jgi:hypothetical protein
MEEHRLRVYGNKVLKRIFGIKKWNLTGVCKAWVLTSVLIICALSLIIIRLITPSMMRRVEHKALIGDRGNVYNFFYRRT